MNRNNIRQIPVWIAVIALLGVVVTSVQVGNLLINDRVFCANQGCAVVESTLVISPLWFNAVGVLYFLCLLFTGIVVKRADADSIAAGGIRLLLICGMTVEGVLVSYQAFHQQIYDSSIRKSFCYSFWSSGHRYLSGVFCFHSILPAGDRF